MKHSSITHTILVWNIIFALILLSGCNAEESTNASPSPSSSPLPSPEYSTRLIDNNIPAGMSFANFKSETFSIDPSLLAFSGDRIFLKLSRQESELLYLGEINRYQPFSIPVETRLDDTQLHYEIFSNNINDEALSGVISL